MTETPRPDPAMLRLICVALGELSRVRTAEDILKVVVLAAHHGYGASGLAVQLRGEVVVHVQVTDGHAARELAPPAVAIACSHALEGGAASLTSNMQHGISSVIAIPVGGPTPHAGVAFYWKRLSIVEADELLPFEALASAITLALNQVAATSTRESRGHEFPDEAMARFYELQRQVRGLLATIRAIVRRTSLSTTTMDDDAAHLDGRLGALGRIHGFLVRVPDRGVDLEELVQSEFLAQSIVPDQAEVTGSTIRLVPKATETMGLALHELVMNSIKFGALGHANGRVIVSWAPDKARPAWIRLEWRESPPELAAQIAKRRGFGFELIEKTLPHQLGALSAITLRPSGLSCIISFPPDAIVQRD